MLGNMSQIEENMVGQKSKLPPRMLQAGPSSGSSPMEIKKRLKTGLDCLQKGLSILEVLLTLSIIDIC